MSASQNEQINALKKNLKTLVASIKTNFVEIIDLATIGHNGNLDNKLTQATCEDLEMRARSPNLVNSIKALQQFKEELKQEYVIANLAQTSPANEITSDDSEFSVMIERNKNVLKDVLTEISIVTNKLKNNLYLE
ncbi:MAG: hypothetical protein MHPSP_002306 [Paramarteilia canceri]